MRALLLAAILATSGCATVEAHRRGRIMTPIMAVSDDPLEAATFEHMLRIREGMQGASGVGAASCGCS